MTCEMVADLARQYQPLLRFHKDEHIFPALAEAWLRHCSSEPWGSPGARLGGTALFVAGTNDRAFGQEEFVRAGCANTGIPGRQPIAVERGDQPHQIGNPAYERQLTSPTVSRRTSGGIPRYRDDDPRPERRDEFLLDGDELVLAEERTGAGPGGDETHRLYRARTEHAFLRVLWRRGGGRDEWEVTSRDGIVARFGTSASARVFSPGPPARVFAWRLSEAVDVFGNRIVYRHRRDDGGVGEATTLAAAGRWHEAGREYNQSYLVGVDYLDHRPPGASADAALMLCVLDSSPLTRPTQTFQPSS